MRWAWALLLAGGRAARAEETRVVIEDFATTTGLWTDTGEVLGLSRETTWRTSAPRLANEDSKQDLNV